MLGEIGTGPPAEGEAQMMDDQIKTIRTARKAPDSANAEPLRKDSAPAIDANATELPRHDFQMNAPSC
jgi:hypothetical protein